MNTTKVKSGFELIYTGLIFSHRGICYMNCTVVALVKWAGKFWKHNLDLFFTLNLNFRLKETKLW